METGKRGRRANQQAWQPERRLHQTGELGMEIITLTPKFLLGAVLAVLVVVIVLAVCSRANGEDEA